MKSPLSNLSFSLLTVAILVNLWFLQGCTTQANQTRETAELPQACTLIGCHDTLSVSLRGESPAEFMISVKDSSDKVGAIQCFEDKRTITTYEYALNVFSLNAPEVKKIGKTSLIDDLCDTENGYIGIKAWKDGFVESITVQCFESDSQEFLNSSCENNGATFESFSPSEVTLSVYWDDKIKTEMIEPLYETFRPNGAGCEPECRNGSLSIELP